MIGDDCTLYCFSYTHTHMYVMTMKLRDTLHQSDIQTKKTRCAVYTHIEENKGHTIDWEKRTFLDKDKALRNEKLKQLYTYAPLTKESQSIQFGH